MSVARPTQVAFAPDGQVLAAGLLSGEVQLYDLKLGKAGPRIQAHAAGVHALAFTADGQQLLTASASDRARLWDALTGRELRSFELEDGQPCTQFALARDGRWLAARYEPGGVAVWDMTSGRVSKRLPLQLSNATSLAFSPDGKQLAVAREDCAVELWAWQTDVAPRRMLGHTSFIPQLAFSPDGRTLASGDWDGAIYLWHVASGQEVLRLHAPGEVSSVTFSLDGSRLLAGGGDRFRRGEIFVWDAAPQAEKAK
jgi:WD40 repeat protein